MSTKNGYWEFTFKVTGSAEDYEDALKEALETLEKGNLEPANAQFLEDYSERDQELQSKVRQELGQGSVEFAHQWADSIDNDYLRFCMKELIKEYEGG